MRFPLCWIRRHLELDPGLLSHPAALLVFLVDSLQSSVPDMLLLFAHAYGVLAAYFCFCWCYFFPSAAAALSVIICAAYSFHRLSCHFEIKLLCNCFCQPLLMPLLFVCFAALRTASCRKYVSVPPHFRNLMCVTRLPNPAPFLVAFVFKIPPGLCFPHLPLKKKTLINGVLLLPKPLKMTKTVDVEDEQYTSCRDFECSSRIVRVVNPFFPDAWMCCSLQASTVWLCELTFFSCRIDATATVSLVLLHVWAMQQVLRVK